MSSASGGMPCIQTFAHFQSGKNRINASGADEVIAR
jgi:hypothetical protein